MPQPSQHNVHIYLWHGATFAAQLCRCVPRDIVCMYLYVLSYVLLYLTLPYILPHLTLPYVLPYILPYLTLPYHTLSLTIP